LYATGISDSSSTDTSIGSNASFRHIVPVANGSIRKTFDRYESTQFNRNLRSIPSGGMPINWKRKNQAWKTSKAGKRKNQAWHANQLKGKISKASNDVPVEEERTNLTDMTIQTLEDPDRILMRVGSKLFVKASRAKERYHQRISAEAEVHRQERQRQEAEKRKSEMAKRKMGSTRTLKSLQSEKQLHLDKAASLRGERLGRLAKEAAEKERERKEKGELTKRLQRALCVEAYNANQQELQVQAEVDCTLAKFDAALVARQAALDAALANIEALLVLHQLWWEEEKHAIGEEFIEEAKRLAAKHKSVWSRDTGRGEIISKYKAAAHFAVGRGFVREARELAATQQRARDSAETQTKDLGSFTKGAKYAVISAPGCPAPCANVKFKTGGGQALIEGEIVDDDITHPLQPERSYRVKRKHEIVDQDGKGLNVIDIKGRELWYAGVSEYAFWIAAISIRQAAAFVKLLPRFSFACVWIPGIKGCCAAREVHDALAACYKGVKPLPPCCQCKWFDTWLVNVRRCYKDNQELRFAFLPTPTYAAQPKFECTAEGYEGDYWVGMAQKIELEYVQNTLGWPIIPIESDDELLLGHIKFKHQAAQLGMDEASLEKLASEPSSMDAKAWARKQLMQTHSKQLLSLKEAAYAALNRQSVHVHPRLSHPPGWQAKNKFMRSKAVKKYTDRFTHRFHHSDKHRPTRRRQPIAGSISMTPGTKIPKVSRCRNGRLAALNPEDAACPDHKLGMATGLTRSETKMYQRIVKSKVKLTNVENITLKLKVTQMTEEMRRLDTSHTEHRMKRWLRQLEDEQEGEEEQEEEVQEAEEEEEEVVSGRNHQAAETSETHHFSHLRFPHSVERCLVRHMLRLVVPDR
jgi:hypothetical protein